MSKGKRKVLKTIALFLAVNLLTQAIFPVGAYALTAGPSSPEFSSFTPVTSTDMVNVFSGDFNYNLPVIEVPGTEGGGYALSLSYNSGTSSEEEASWVGFGWTLNPGAINRNTRGFPDDYKNVPITLYNKTRPNWSISTTQSVGIEVFGKDQPDFGIDGSVTTRVNNQQGFYYATGLGITIKGMAGIQMNSDPNGITFSADVNPINIINKATSKMKKKNDNNPQAKTDKDNNTSHKNLKKSVKETGKAMKQTFQNATVGLFGSNYGLFSYSEAVRAASLTEYKGGSFNLTWPSVSINGPIPVGIHTATVSNFNLQYNLYKSQGNAYGYMFNPSSAQQNVHSDYYVEKDEPFTKRNYFLGVPFNNADIFSVSGEGIGGGFRFYPYQVGEFYPNQVKSTTNIFQLGFQLMFGLDIGVGVNFGIGKEVNKTDAWQSSIPFSADSGIFRFNGDQGGKIDYDSTNTIDVAFLNYDHSAPPGTKSVSYSLSKNYTIGNSPANPVNRSSYVAYHSYANVGQGFTNNFTATGGLPDEIAEISVHNEDGNRYVYSQPVLTKNETNLQIDVQPPAADKPDNIVNRYLAYKPLQLQDNGGWQVNPQALQTDPHKTVIGEIRQQPYPVAHLLTSITTPDYVDVNANGPDVGDLGGWTKFTYQQGNGGNWYRYRSPYNGLLYSQNDVSDISDDMGSVLTGEKQLFYLNTIETSTHIAIFYTNTRQDGLGAAELSGGDPNALSPTAKGTDQMQYLDSIALYAKNRMSTPIKVVHFSYDYSLVPGLPNNTSGAGKLTLKKVWFDYEGTVLARVSPYEFFYDYANSSYFPASLKNGMYAGILSAYDTLSSDAQNPSYSPYLLDQWGNPQPYGAQRYNADLHTRYQGILPAKPNPGGSDWRQNIFPNEQYDPAAWQLKRIKFPSGGEIHVHYEQKDYAYVQDRTVMGLAALIPGMQNASEVIPKSQNTVTYVVDPADLGADPTNQSQVNTLVAKINNQFQAVSPGSTDVATQKIYFRFLYALLGSDPDLDICASEYIHGYANFMYSQIVSNPKGGYGIQLTLGKENSSSGAYALFPYQGCVTLVSNQRQQKLGKPGEIPGYQSQCQSGPEASLETTIKTTMANNSENQTEGNSLKSMLNFLAIQPMINSVPLNSGTGPSGLLSAEKSGYYDTTQICTTIKPENSFFKLPLLGAKQGGGARVKRVLMFDPGMETGDAALYGTEYSYTLSDGTSSGVATNEPSGAREENPLVTFLPQKGQSWFSRLTVGEDKEQTEGPIGETTLPSPSVGYSRVVVRNIYNVYGGQKSGTGFTVHDFYTVKDYPFDKVYNPPAGAVYDANITGSGVNYTDIDDQQTRDYVIIPAGLFTFSLNKAWAAQGYRFIINNMHGQMKKVSTYGGTYSNDLTTAYLTSSQEYDYYDPGEKVKTMTASSNGAVSVAYSNPGKETDVAMESRQISDMTMDLTVGVNISITPESFLPPIFVTVVPTFDISEQLVNTHSISKVIHYPAIVKSMLAFQDGIYSLSENLVLNSYTGKPALIRTHDSFDGALLPGGQTIQGLVYNFTLPASYPYPAMGQKAINPSNTNQLTEAAGRYVSYNVDPTTTGWLSAPTGVLSASATTFSNQYPGSSSIWREQADYVYEKTANIATGKAYSGGTFSITKPFNYTSPTLASNGEGWLRTRLITQYDPNGSADEEVNAIGIYSSVLYGYNDRLVSMKAQNARLANISFNDFELSNPADPTIAHSGSGYLSLAGNGSSATDSALVSGIQYTPELNKGGLLRLWARQVNAAAGSLNLSAIIGKTSFPLQLVTSTGKWAQYSVRIPSTAFAASTSISLSYNQSIYVDDVRFQPYEAEAVCYVYDNAFRPIVIFDDQHFGLFYQYNNEGKLVRKLIETEEGTKTIQETQYNSYKVQRPQQ